MEISHKVVQVKTCGPKVPKGVGRREVTVVPSWHVPVLARGLDKSPRGINVGMRQEWY